MIRYATILVVFVLSACDTGGGTSTLPGVGSLYPEFQGTYRPSEECLLEWAGSAVSGSCANGSSQGDLTGVITDVKFSVSGQWQGGVLRSFSGENFPYTCYSGDDCTYTLDASMTKSSGRASQGTFKAFAGTRHSEHRP